MNIAYCGWVMISFLQVGVLKFHLRITRLQFCLVYWLIIRGLSLLVSQTSFSCRSESSNKSLVVLVISSACTADFSLSLNIFTRREKLKAVINFNSRCIWLFYNEIGAVAQCPNNWGVGSAFHRMKIHIHNINLTRIDLQVKQTYDFLRKKIWTVPLILQFNICIFMQ